MTHVLRAACHGDLDALYQMAKRTGGGFTNLPPNRGYLERKLERAEEAFGREATEPGDDAFLFVLESAASGKVVGTCQIFARIGSTWPFYSYRLGRVTQFSEALNRTFRADTLTLCNDLDGLSEVGGLFLAPEERATGIGKLLARGRYLFIKAHRERFADRVIAELRGVQDEAGSSPFWDGLAGRFFDMSFREADDFNAVNGNQFIADLMPKHTIYIALISDSARAAIGVPNQSGRAAMRMLEDENFEFANYVDIFDGGPTMIGRTDAIRTVAAAESAPLAAIGATEGEPRIVASGRLGGFRACHAAVARHGEGVAVPPDAARLLRAKTGDTVLHAPA